MNSHNSFCEGLNADVEQVLEDISMMGEAGEEMQMDRADRLVILLIVLINEIITQKLIT